MDGGVLQSRSAAIQIGGETRAAFSTLVFQNITIQQSHRCGFSQPRAVAKESVVLGVPLTSKGGQDDVLMGSSHPHGMGVGTLECADGAQPKKAGDIGVLLLCAAGG